MSAPSQGGTAGNITARDCRFGIEFRTVPGDGDAEDWEARFRAEAARVEAAMKAIHPDAAITSRKATACRR
jgi:acetylornithine deacetylase